MLSVDQVFRVNKKTLIESFKLNLFPTENATQCFKGLSNIILENNGDHIPPLVSEEVHKSLHLGWEIYASFETDPPELQCAIRELAINALAAYDIELPNAKHFSDNGIMMILASDIAKLSVNVLFGSTGML